MDTNLPIVNVKPYSDAYYILRDNAIAYSRLVPKLRFHSNSINCIIFIERNRYNYKLYFIKKISNCLEDFLNQL
jgi:hypothetical protein